MDLQKYTEYTVHLLRCSKTGEVPSALPEGITLGGLLEFCKSHKIENTVYYPLKKLNIDASEMVEFERAHLLAVILDVNQAEALENTVSLFDQNNIKHLALKGSVLKYLYPSTDMRQSADVDIYIGEENAVKAKEIMLSQGFSTNESLFGIGPDDSYMLSDCINIELHRSLIPDVYSWKLECARIEKSIVLKDGTEYEYEMSRKDFYI